MRRSIGMGLFIVALFIVTLLIGCGGSGGTPPNQAPTVVVTAPAENVEIGLSQGGSVSITYTDRDPDDEGLTDVFADRDGDLGTTADQVLIEGNRPEMDGTAQTVTWTVTGVAPGNYKILARTRSAGSQAVDAAPGVVTLNAACILTITEPSSDVVVSRGGVVTVEYADDDPDNVALTWISADEDGDPATGGPGDVTLSPRPEMGGVSQVVGVRLARTGHFSILGTTWDGTNTPTTHTAVGQVDVKNVAWVKQAGGGNHDYGEGVAAFPDGSSVVTGYFQFIATFGFGESNETTLTSPGGEDVFVARYNANGTLAWAKRAGGANRALGTGIAAFPDGSLIVTGYFEGSATFGPGESGVTTLTSAGLNDVFVARYNANGTLAWAKRAGGSGYDAGRSIAALVDGSLVVTGNFEGSATFGPGESGVTTLTSAGGTDAFVARYNADGTLALAKRAGGSSNDQGQGIAVFPDGSFVVTGRFEDSATFGLGESGVTTLTSAGLYDVFAARYSANGTLEWAKRAGGSDLDMGQGIAAFSDGSLVVTGHFMGSATFGYGEINATTLTAIFLYDVFVARYNADGGL